MPVCAREKVMTSELDDFSEPSFTHPLGCCDGCNIIQYCSDFIDDYENNSVLNVLTAWVELNKIGITPITERKLIGYLKGRISDFMKTVLNLCRRLIVQHLVLKKKRRI